MKKLFVFTLFGLLAGVIGAGPGLAAESPFCGSFKSVSGKIFILRGDQGQIPVTLDTKIYPKDQIQSGEKSSASIILQDDTIICLGPESSLTMDEFIFNPSEFEYSMTTKLLKGTFLFISGVISKLAPDDMNIQTPDGTIAVRGTRFLVEVNP